MVRLRRPRGSPVILNSKWLDTERTNFPISLNRRNCQPHATSSTPGLNGRFVPLGLHETYGFNDALKFCTVRSFERLGINCMGGSNRREKWLREAETSCDLEAVVEATAVDDLQRLLA